MSKSHTAKPNGRHLQIFFQVFVPALQFLSTKNMLLLAAQPFRKFCPHFIISRIGIDCKAFRNHRIRRKFLHFL